MPRVVHFDLSADDPERAARFYREVFDWRIEKWPGPFDYWLIQTGRADEPGIDGGLAKREQPTDSVTTIIDVPSVDEYASRVLAGGGRIVRPKQTIPGVGQLVTACDTEGNVFGMMQAERPV